MRWVLVAALVGCSQRSMAIEVHTTVPGVDHVELVIVRDQCSDDACTGVAPPSSIAKPTGTIYYQVAGERFVADVRGDIAGFLLEPGTDDYVPRVAAIGFGGFGANEKPLGIGIIDTDFHIKDHLGEVFQLELSPHAIQQAEGAVPFDVGPDDLVVVWRAPNAPETAQSCLAIQPRSGAATFVVPEDDPDCDGIIGRAECDPFWYQYVKPTTGTEQACFAQHATSDPCIVGRETTCVDGQEDQCTPGTFCVPSATCHDCNSVFDPGCLDKVAKETDPTVAKVTCKVPVLTNAGMFNACPGASMPVGLNVQFNNADCMPGLVPRSLALPLQQQPTLAFDTGEGVVSVTVVPSGFNDCSFQLALPTTPLSGMPQQQIPGVVLLHGASHQLVLPLVVDFVMSTAIACGAPDTKIQCAAVPASIASDPIWTCGTH
jgi:hypothetical protein